MHDVQMATRALPCGACLNYPSVPHPIANRLVAPVLSCLYLLLRFLPCSVGKCLAQIVRNEEQQHGTGTSANSSSSSSSPVLPFDQLSRQKQQVLQGCVWALPSCLLEMALDWPGSSHSVVIEIAADTAAAHMTRQMLATWQTRGGGGLSMSGKRQEPTSSKPLTILFLFGVCLLLLLWCSCSCTAHQV